MSFPVTLFSASFVAGWRRPAWMAALVVATMAFSSLFACATPFAALAVVAVATLARRDAIFCVLAAWLANQLIGFALLGYPQTSNSFVWGGVIGIAAVACVFASAWALPRSMGAVWKRLVMTFAASVLAYQAVMLLASLTPLGGMDDFTVSIIGYVVGVNAMAIAGLLALRYAVSVTFARKISA